MHRTEPMSREIKTAEAVREDAGRVERPTNGRADGEQFGAQRKYAARNLRQSVATDAGRYLRARLILNDLKEKHLAGKITYDECKALRVRAIEGDVDGAMKGLAMLLRMRELEGMGL